MWLYGSQGNPNLYKKSASRSTCSLTFGHDQGRQSRGSQGRADGITLLVNVDSAVPTAPGLCGGKHATTTTHLQWSQGSTFHTNPCSQRLSDQQKHLQVIFFFFNRAVLIFFTLKKTGQCKVCAFRSYAQSSCCYNTMACSQDYFVKRQWVAKEE